MQKLLLVEDNIELREIVEEMIEDSFDLKVVSTTTTEEAIDILADDDQIVGIISDYYLKGQLGSVVYRYNFKKTKHPFTFLTGTFLSEIESELKDFRENQGYRFFIPKPFEEDALLLAIRKMLKANLGREAVSYKRVRTSFLKKYLKESTDLYLKIAPGKFLKVMNKASEFDLDFIVRYETKEEEFLYMEKEAYERFFHDVQHLVEEEVQSVQSEEGALGSATDVLAFVNESLRNFGVGESQLKMIDDVVGRCTFFLRGDKQLKNYIETIFKEKDYLLAHSILTMHFCYMMVKNTNLASKETTEKFVYSALLHDVFLPNSKLSKIISKEMDEFKMLEKSERSLVKQHPLLAAKLVEKNQNLSIDIAHIIEQHHERPTGKGFPRGITAASIRPLSSVFILGLVAADHICLHGYREDALKYLRGKLEAQFDEGNFKTYLRELLNYLK